MEVLDAMGSLRSGGGFAYVQILRFEVESVLANLDDLVVMDSCSK